MQPVVFALIAVTFLGQAWPAAGGLHLPLKTASSVRADTTPPATTTTTTRRPARGRDRSYISYVVELNLGVPAQRRSFIVDTGSAALAVSGPRCLDAGSGLPCQNRLVTYDPELSSTSYNTQVLDSVTYDKGYWLGEVYRDVVSVVDINGTAVSTNVSFAAITTSRNFFEKTVGNSGIWGLGYRDDQEQLLPLFDSLVEGEAVTDEFSLVLCGNSGHLFLGSLSPEQRQYHGELQYTPILHNADSPLHYMVSMLDIEVDGVALGLPPDNRAIVDSGTTFLLLPPRAYHALMRHLKGSMPLVDKAIWQQYCVDTDPATWPTLTLRLAGVEFLVPGPHYMNKQGNFYCLGIGITSSAGSVGAIIGDAVLQGMFVHFDRANGQVGFAPAAHVGDEHCGRDPGWRSEVTAPFSVVAAADGMPAGATATSCGQCTRAGLDWCPMGRAAVWVDGVLSTLEMPDGFCWPGTALALSATEVQSVFLPGHGYATVVVECASLPYSMQCRVDPNVLAVAFAFVTAFAMFSLLATALFVLVSPAKADHCEGDGPGRKGAPLAEVSVAWDKPLAAGPRAAKQVDMAVVWLAAERGASARL